MSLIRRRQKMKRWPGTGKSAHIPEQVKVMPLEGMGLVRPTRLMFEENELDKVVYHMRDGRVVSYERIEEDDEQSR